MIFLSILASLLAIAYGHENCLASVIDTGLVKRSEGKFSYSGEKNPESWYTLPDSSFCKLGVGQQQTPVDFISDKNLKQAGDPSLPVIQWAKYEEAEFVNTGLTVEVELGDKVPEKTTLTFPNQPGETYVLQQFHFHDPSEHTINGKAFPLEAHFVFKSASGKLAVFGVFFQFASGNDIGFLGQLVPYLPASPEQPTKLHSFDLSAIGKHISDASSGGLYRYVGSLTTPPCAEGLEWTVLKQPLCVGPRTLARFWGAMVKNARYTQRELK